jgi:uncharacterized protein (TIGR02453 family)
MIPIQVFQFLEELAANNNREWFQANKKRYDTAKESVANFMKAILNEVQSFDNSIIGIEPKDCIFRINRDVRFSNDKSPYKTNIGGFMAKGGRKAMNAGYYLHIEPGKSFLAGGIYMPPPDKLKLIRNEIYFNPENFKKIIAAPDFKKYFKEIWDEEKLKNPPKDFPKDYPDIDLLKYKNYTVIHSLTDNQLQKADFLNYSVKVFKAMYPLNDYMNKAINN